MDSISTKKTSLLHTGFSVTRAHLNGSVVIVLTGELDMSSTADLEDALVEFIPDGPEDVVLDLSGLTFMESTGIGVLITAHKQLEDLGRRLIIRSPKAIVLKALEVTNLTDYLNIVD